MSRTLKRMGLGKQPGNRQIFASSPTILEHEKINSDSHAGHKDETAHAAKSECPTYRDGGDSSAHGRIATPGELIHKVPPSDPKAARKAHIQKTVPLCALITNGGRVSDLRFVSAPKELIEPAMKAVRQWVYESYLVDGKPVEVETNIQVQF